MRNINEFVDTAEPCALSLYLSLSRSNFARYIRYLGSERSTDVNREMPDKTVEKIWVAPRINNVYGRCCGQTFGGYELQLMRDALRGCVFPRGVEERRIRARPTSPDFRERIHSSETPIGVEIYFPSLDSACPPSAFPSRVASRPTFWHALALDVFALPLYVRAVATCTLYTFRKSLMNDFSRISFKQKSAPWDWNTTKAVRAVIAVQIIYIINSC